MENGCGNEELIFRDGASQRGRRLLALDPSHFSVEERSTEDLIRFARYFAKELKFFNLQNQWEGEGYDWTGFLGDPEDEEKLKELLAFMENPESFADQPEKLAWLTRPHLTVFLAFLEMLKEPKQHLDDLTRRHLDFYYREALQLPEKPAVSDKVHVLFEPARGVEAHRIKAGTLLYGGKDSSGKDLHYATDEDLLVTQARVADIRRVFREEETGRIYTDISWQEGQEIVPDAKYHALGMDLINSKENNLSLVQIGFAISSPLLELSGGNRTITLNFSVPRDAVLDADLIKKVITFSLSVEEEEWWVVSPENVIDQSPDIDPGTPDKKIVIDLAVHNAPPIVAPTAEGMDFEFPVLRAGLNQNELTDKERKALWLLQANDIQLSVKVEGLSALAIRNEDGVLSSDSSFLPFGGWPRSGSPFTFSHSELCRKSIASATLHFTWKGKPTDIDIQSGHYKLYLEKGFPMELPFKATLRVNTSTARQTQKLFSETLKFNLHDFNLLSDASKSVSDTDDPLNFTRYFQLLLESPDFQHSNYPLLLHKLTDKELEDLENVKAPYTPEIQPFMLDYISGDEFLTTKAGNQNLYRFYHWQPFGYGFPCADVENAEDKIRLLPGYPEQGNLYIGLRDVESTARLSLLFQLHPASSDEKKPELHWSYLEENCWRDIPDQQILVDRTSNLMGAGLVQIELPKVSNLDHQALPAGLYWLRASAPNPEAAGSLIAIHAQAASATWQDQGNAPDHLNQPLPAESITELLRRDPNIRAVAQPYTSFGARPAEQPDRYHTRISERLRHKQRALSGWDYERLVLDRFPEVYKVKCLTPREKMQLPKDENFPEPGDVILVVIPNIAQAAPFFPLEPRLSNDKREEIGNYLMKYVSPFTQIEIRNPRFEYIRYRMDIRFHKDYDENLYSKKLNEALHRFLSPWAYDASADIAFGSRIFHSEVIYFIEKLPYVDYVVNFKLARQYRQGEEEWDCIDDNGCAAARYPDSILVSHGEHFIGAVDKDDYDPKQYKGIGYERIGVDHKVAKSSP